VRDADARLVPALQRRALVERVGAQQVADRLVDLEVVLGRLDRRDDEVAELAEARVGVVVEDLGHDRGERHELGHGGERAAHHRVQRRVHQSGVRGELAAELEAPLGVDEAV